jgi:hypothetical protein
MARGADCRLPWDMMTRKVKNGITETAPIFGFKYLFIDKRDPSLSSSCGFGYNRDKPKKGAVAFGNLK